MDLKSKIKLKLPSYKIKFIEDSGLFDLAWYQRTSGRTFATIQAAIGHYIRDGSTQGFNPNALFDIAFYRGRNPDIAATGADPLTHYLRHGAREGRDPHALFDTKFYLQKNSDVAASGINPLVHFLLHGGLEGRDPHPLFRSQFYLERNGDVAAAGMNPLVHYLSSGWEEGRDPHPLFRTSYYIGHSSDVVAAKINPLVHYVVHGAREGRNPHPLFDAQYYLDRHADLKEIGGNPLLHFIAGKGLTYENPHPLFDSAYYLGQVNRPEDTRLNPLEDYILRGAAENANPHPLFDTLFYKSESVPGASGLNPLEHYVSIGFNSGSKPNSVFDPDYYRRTYMADASPSLNPLVHYIDVGAARGYLPASNFATTDSVGSDGATPLAKHLERLKKSVSASSTSDVGYVPPPGLLPWFDPLNIATAPMLALRPRLNVLLPWVSMKSMSGGPNTVLNFVYRLAALGIPLRLVSVNLPPDADHGPIFAHCRTLSGLSEDLAVDIEIVDGSDRSKPLYLGENDLFFATAWWTAQMAHYAVKKMKVRTFIYFIQDYEPILHEGSTQQTLALESYDFDIIPIFNTKFLRDYFVTNKVGIFKDEAISRQAMYFDPAIDTKKFHYVSQDPKAKKRLLFYARPTFALRNLFELGVAALQKIVADGIANPAEWEFVAMGEPINPQDLGNGAQLVPAPWLGFEEYARQMRESAVLLSLMQSPHPSYPPLEFAACGRPVVTSEFANKSADALKDISPNILAAPPNVEALAKMLALAVGRTFTQKEPIVDITYPDNWDDAFKEVLPECMKRLRELLGLAPLPQAARLPWRSATGYVPGFDRWPTGEYEFQRLQGLHARLSVHPPADASIFSFLTTVWNTKPEYLYELAETVFAQNSGTAFEWIILDNGSKDGETRAALKDIARHPSVKLLRVTENLGIIGGMRYVLERATRKYIVPLDSDDLLTPDCLSVVANYLKANNYPALAYTDEDKVMASVFRDPYVKPDWDPVLFYHSCYIAHLCIIDRELLLKVGGYSDSNSTGSHDWDTFTKFHQAGYTPLHIPEVLYTWRMHEMSTASNIDSKSYIASSHRNVLGQFINGSRDPEHIRLDYSPMFAGTPDWRFVYTKASDRPVITVLIGGSGDAPPIWTEQPFANHSIARIAGIEARADLMEIAEAAKKSGALIHLLADSVEIDDPMWCQEAVSLMHMFPDSCIVGGRIHSGSTIQAADIYFDVGDGVRSPNTGRSIKDPGYFAQAWKPRSCDAVPSRHCVVRPEILIDTLKVARDLPISLDGLAIWMGRIAQSRRGRVIYSPLISARRKDADALLPNAVEMRAQLILNTETHSVHARWPHRLGRTVDTAYSIVANPAAKVDAAAVAQAKGDPVAAYMARCFTTRDVPIRSSISILTSVWERTPVDLFRLTVQSLLDQDHPFQEWVILENGPISDEVASILTKLQSDPRFKRLKISRNIGIVRAMKYCLEHAECDLIVPMDADDLLVPDALFRVAAQLEADKADFVFSDETMLVGDNVLSPYIRGPFDDVLNQNDSYIWHLCAFRREAALDLGVYADVGAEYCHDWDTVSKFSRAGARIAYAPHVLYKWRIHQQSSSNSGSLNEGSLASVRNVLQANIDRTRKPDLYRIAPFPLWRGVEQLAILRNEVAPTKTTIIVLGLDHQLPEAPPVLARIATKHKIEVVGIPDAFKPDGVRRFRDVLKSVRATFVMVVVEGCMPESPDAFWEAMRLLEMHENAVAAGGRGYDSRGIVLSACQPVEAVSRDVPAWVGKHVEDAGPYALALKPQTVEDVPSSLFMARTDFLRKIVDVPVLEASSIFMLGRLIGEAAKAAKRIVAYSPLIQGREVIPIQLFGSTKVAPAVLAEVFEVVADHPPVG